MSENTLIWEVNGRMGGGGLMDLSPASLPAAVWRYRVSMEQILWEMFQALYEMTAHVMKLCDECVHIDHYSTLHAYLCNQYKAWWTENAEVAI